MIKAETFHLRTISEADLPVLYQHWANIANRGDCYLLEIPSELNIRKCSKRMASGRGKGIMAEGLQLCVYPNNVASRGLVSSGQESGYGSLRHLAT